MNKLFIILLLSIGTSAIAIAQNNKTFTIELYNPQSVQENLINLGNLEAEYWTAVLDLDSAMQARMSNNGFSLYMQYVEVMKQFNYTMEKVLLAEQYNFKTRRDRFMKTFLSAEQYEKFKEIVDKTAEKRMAQYTDEPSKLIQSLRLQAAGWNVIGQTIIFK